MSQDTLRERPVTSPSFIEGGTSRFKKSPEKKLSSSHNTDVNFAGTAGHTKTTFADVVKKGVQSFSPFKVPVRHEEQTDDKKTRFGPPKINLNDADLDIIAQTVK
jgi:hypothetical protein